MGPGFISLKKGHLFVATASLYRGSKRYECVGVLVRNNISFRGFAKQDTCLECVHIFVYVRVHLADMY